MASASHGGRMGLVAEDSDSQSIVGTAQLVVGWQRSGVIPDYALWAGGGLCSTTVFHRRL